MVELHFRLTLSQRREKTVLKSKIASYGIEFMYVCMFIGLFLTRFINQQKVNTELNTKIFRKNCFIFQLL